MKKILLTTILCCPLISACSRVNSMEPFDQRQAAILIQEGTVKKPAQGMVALTLPNKLTWKRIDLSANKQGSPILLVPRNENASDWQQSIRTQIISYTYSPDITANKFAQILIHKTKHDCFQVHAKILEQTELFSYYRLETSDCQNQKNQTQIGKAFNGNDALYVVYYSASENISRTQINKMGAVIKSAQLVRNPSYR